MRDSRLRALIGREFTPWNPAWVCVASGLALSLLGVYTIDLATSLKPPGGPLDLSGRPLKQAMFLLAGLAVCLVSAAPHPRVLRLAAWALTLPVLGLLVFLLIPGVPRWLVSPQNGSRAWITLGSLNFQPSELAKIVFVLVLADYLRLRSTHRSLRGLVTPFIIAGVPVGLITLQPDLGTALLFIPTLGAMLVAAGARLKHLALIVVVAALSAPAAYPALMPHQKARIQGLVLAFRGDKQGADSINFQMFTSQMLAGAGGVNGVGDARCRALTKHSTLPYPHTDMIYAVVVNRFGVVGGLATIGLYALWLLGALATAATVRDGFSRLVAIGCAAFIAAQTVITIGMTMGLLPIIGITLPFLSYGGSSLLAVWAMTGLVLGVGLRRPRPPYRRVFEWSE